MAILRFSKIHQKLKKKSDRPDFWCKGVSYADISLCQIWYESVERQKLSPKIENC